MGGRTPKRLIYFSEVQSPRQLSAHVGTLAETRGGREPLTRAWQISGRANSLNSLTQNPVELTADSVQDGYAVISSILGTTFSTSAGSIGMVFSSLNQLASG